MHRLQSIVFVVSALCILVPMAHADNVDHTDTDLLATELWTSSSEQDAKRAYAKVGGVSVKEYPVLLEALSASPHYGDNEASYYLTSLVSKFFLQKAPHEIVQRELVKLLEADTTALMLKTILLHDVRTWAKGSDPVALIQKIDGLGKKDQEFGPSVQYAISQILRGEMSVGNREGAKADVKTTLKAQARAQIAVSFDRLLSCKRPVNPIYRRRCSYAILFLERRNRLWTGTRMGCSG